MEQLSSGGSVTLAEIDALAFRLFSYGVSLADGTLGSERTWHAIDESERNYWRKLAEIAINFIWNEI